MADINKVIVIDVEDNASTPIGNIKSELDSLDSSINNVDSSTEKLSSSQKKNTQTVLENGGAMGLLNDLTGGYAMMVKDAVEASELFSKEGRIATAVQTAYAAVVGTSTGAMKAFRLALAATGIGLIVIALGLLVANFDKVVKYVQMGIDKFKGMGEGAKLLVSVLFPIVGVVRLITAALEEMGVIDDDATKKAKKNAEERIKALNKDKVKIEEKYNTEIRLAAAAGKDTTKLEQEKRKAILQTLLALNDAERARIRSGEATADDIKKWNERQKEIRKINEDIKVAEVEAEKKAEDKKKEIADKAAEKKKERIEREKQAEKKRQDDLRKLVQDYNKQLEDLDADTDAKKLKLEKDRKEAELNNLKATEEEKIAFRKLYARKEEDLEKSRQEKITAIQTDYSNRLRELNAKTDKERLDLELRKQEEEEIAKLAELERLNASEEQKKAVRDYYIQLEKDTRDNFNLSEEEKRKAAAAKLLEEEIALNEQRIAVEDAYRDAKRNALQTGLDILMMFAGKNKAIALGILAIQKGLAIADVVVGASKAIALAKFNLSQVPFIIPPGVVNPAWGVQAGMTVKSIATTKIAAAASIASILASGISQASQITGGDAGGGAGGGGIAGAPAAPQAQFNVVGTSNENQLARTIAGQQQRPVQAYVVGSDVTTQQSLDRNKVNNATFL